VKNLKGQVTIPYILIVVIVLVVAVVSLLLYSTLISHSVTSKTLLQITNFSSSNIYNGNQSFYFNILTNKNVFIKGNNYTLNEKIKFTNGTSLDVAKNFTLVLDENISPTVKFYQFFTTNVITSNFSGIATVSLEFLKNNVSSFIYPTSPVSDSVSVYSKNSTANLPYFLLTTNTTPPNTGLTTPASEYFHEGTIININATPKPGYGFISWFGSGKGNYTGEVQNMSFVLESNTSEIAMFGLLAPLYIKSTYPGLSVKLGGQVYTTNASTVLTEGNEYTYLFPTTYTSSTGVFYNLKYVSNCGTDTNSTGTIFMSPSYANCSLTGYYNVLVPINININNIGSEISGTSVQITFANGSTSSCSASCKYMAQVGQQIKLYAISSSNGYFNNYTGTGTGSYSGTNKTITLTVSNPITEIANFIPGETVFIASNSQISGNINNKIPITTNTTITLPANRPFNFTSNGILLPGFILKNWGTRLDYSINSSKTSCLNSGNIFTATNKTNSTRTECSVYFSPPTIQYAIIFKDTLNGINTTGFPYGNVFFDNGTEAQTVNWINANTVVQFYGTNNEGNYGFKNFTTISGTINGTTVNTGFSGIDSVPTTQPTNINCQCSNYNQFFADTQDFSFALYQYNYSTPTVNITSPIIEQANYVKTNSVISGTQSITINYNYYNISVDYSSSSSNQWDYYLSSYTTKSGQLTINETLTTPISNYTAGIGTYNIYYEGTNELFVSLTTNPDTFMYNLNVVNSKSFFAMSPEFKNIFNSINSYMNNKFPYIETNVGPYESNTKYISFSYTFDNMTVYENYGKPTGSGQYCGDLFYGNTGGSTEWVSCSTNFAFSNTYAGQYLYY